MSTKKLIDLYQNGIVSTVQELTYELQGEIDTFDFDRKRRVLKLLLWGQPGIGVFLNPDYSV
ncbi:MAG: hypothetical protein HYZ72_08345, partial [Deltaproteobacteria bacterium]|nr:hypothetical protein [Deltaproteobacteria bacterium]